jgi:hypothetical protein
MWVEFMTFVHSSAEVQGVMYGLFGMVVALPASLVGQLFKRVRQIPNDKIPLVMGGILLASCWVVSFYIPNIDRANLITAAGLGGLLSGGAHDAVLNPAKVAIAESGIFKPKGGGDA